MSGAVAVINALRGATSVTSLLGASTDIVQTREEQGQAKPYIVVESDLTEPNDTYSSQQCDEYTVQTYIVAEQPNTEGSQIGCEEIGVAVRAVVHAMSGTYNGVEVKAAKFNRRMSPEPIHIGNKPEFEMMMDFTVWIAP